MSGCCDPKGYRQVFNSREAERTVRRFEKKGLDSTAAAMVAALTSRGVEGASLLEVGAGSGTAQVGLLEAGVARTVAYDISPSYEKIAGALLAGRGLADRVEWRTGDVLADEGVPRADIVFLNRVVCCYPEMVSLVDRVAGRSGRLLAMSYPRDRWAVRAVIGVLNLFLRLRKVPFRTFVHDPEEVSRRVAAAGLTEVESGETAAWHWKVWERAPA